MAGSTHEAHDRHGNRHLLAHVDRNVCVVTFNRSEHRKALSDGVHDGFVVGLPAMAAGPEVRVVLVTGAWGEFCAAGDVEG